MTSRERERTRQASGERGEVRTGGLPTRRDILALGIGAFVVASVPLVRRGRGRTMVRRQIPAMGTVADVAVLHADARYAQRAIDAAFAEIRRTESLLTRFRSESDIGRVNLATPGTPVGVDAETGAVLESALALAAATGGRFDPALGRATELWDVGARRTPPDRPAIESLAARGSFRAVEVDRTGARTTVRIHEPGVSLDLGAIGKGWGVDRAVGVLRDWGVRDGLVNLGGDLYALGTSEDGDPWKVGVRDPDRPGELISRLQLDDGAVATSGDYEKYFTHRGRRFHHILDPVTGEPVRTSTRSVTVAHDRCSVADACATALFSVPPAELRAVLAGAAPSAEMLHLERDPTPPNDHLTAPEA